MKHKFGSSKLLAAKVVALAGLSGPLGWIVFILAKRISEWLANHGVMFINTTIINFETDADQKAFEKAMDEAHKILEEKKNLTKEELDAIDNKVIEAFDKFVVFSRMRND